MGCIAGWSLDSRARVILELMLYTGGQPALRWSSALAIIL
jgi:hypothetical protein